MRIKRETIVYETNYDDVPEDIKELVDKGVYSKEDCICEVIEERFYDT